MIDDDDNVVARIDDLLDGKLEGVDFFSKFEKTQALEELAELYC
jgi:hypothetical protein